MSTVEAPPGETVRLPEALSRRISQVLGPLGYGDFSAFVLEAVRLRLEATERAAYFLGKDAPRGGL